MTPQGSLALEVENFFRSTGRVLRQSKPVPETPVKDPAARSGNDRFYGWTASAGQRPGYKTASGPRAGLGRTGFRLLREAENPVPQCGRSLRKLAHASYSPERGGISFCRRKVDRDV